MLESAELPGGGTTVEPTAGDLDLPSDSVVTVFPDPSERYLPKAIYPDFDSLTG